MKLLTLARDLKRRKARERQGFFVAEGVRAAEELLQSGLLVEGALVEPSMDGSPRAAALRDALVRQKVPISEVSEHDLASAADTESPQGIILIGRVPDRPLSGLTVPARARFLVLDGVQDPGNVGTMIRTAAALGVTATLALPGTVDLWNAKVVRSAMGSLFQHFVTSATWEMLDEFLSGTGAVMWGADAEGEPLAPERFPERLALVVGNEGAGLSSPARSRVAKLVAISLAPGVESLNVAVATGILLHLLRP